MDTFPCTVCGHPIPMSDLPDSPIPRLEAYLVAFKQHIATECPFRAPDKMSLGATS